MSDCPAYVAVTVTDVVLSDELFRYDLLVLCPSIFNVSFRFPSMSMRSTQDLVTSSFDVHISDAATSHHVYLTHVDLRRLNYDEDERSEAIVFHHRVSASTSSYWNHSVLFYVVAVVIVVLALLSAFIHADRHLRLARWAVLKPFPVATDRQPPVSDSACSYRLCANGHVGCPPTTDQPVPSAKYPCYCRRPADARSVRLVSSSRYRLLVFAYASLWLVTGLLATFNVFFYVVSLIVDADWQHVASITGDGQADLARGRRAAEINFSLLIDEHRRDEMRRYRDGVVERADACRNHVDNSIRRTCSTLASESADITDTGWSVAALAAEQYASRLSSYGSRVDEFTDAFQGRLTAAVGRSMRRYGAYVNSLINNVWLRFAVHVFNSTRDTSPPGPPSTDVHNSVISSQPMAQFGTFLDVDEVKQVEMWILRFWQRYTIVFSLSSPHS